MISRKLRKQIYDRDEWKCVVCATQVGLTLQHRINRGMGGSKLLDIPENLITMCFEHNMALESDSRFAQRGRANGWKLWSWQNPKDEPVGYSDGFFYYLNDRLTKVKKHD